MLDEPRPAQEGNDKIKAAIEEGKPFLASKIGSVERTVISDRVQFNYYHQQTMFEASNNAGISPGDVNTLDFFFDCYTGALSSVSFLGLWPPTSEEAIVVQNFAPQAECFSLRFMEPFYFDNPWSEALEGKKVLVIHPFEEDIVSQYEKRELLWNHNVLPRFELKTIKSEQTNGGGLNGNNLTFPEALEVMISKMEKVDYDIAVIGCGAYGLILADFALAQGKQAVHMGGGVQIMFGIKGRRWDHHPDISLMYNDHWCRPHESTRPVRFNQIEGGTYW
tara:strand:+ start:815 stop:1648 length:834 start_codon:yes stop_codon:yes gene_type:complete